MDGPLAGVAEKLRRPGMSELRRRLILFARYCAGNERLDYEHCSSGDDDQIVPIGVSAMRSSRLIRNATLKVYKGAPHGVCTTHKTQVNEDLLAFIKG